MTSIQHDHDRKNLLKKALSALDEMKAKLQAAERAKVEPIAVVGLSCRFPGGANSPEQFWDLLMEGRCATGEVPSDRWTTDDFAALNGGEARTCYGGFLDQVDQFDPHFFGISPREATLLDPQQRLVLEVAWEALERGGLAPDQLRHSLTGVFIGITTNDYAQLTRASNSLDVYMATGAALNAAAGRIAYTLGLQGPCMAIDTACASSLVAVHLACQSLRLREADMALAGGVNVLLTPEPFVCFTNWGMMAPDGQCKTFDAQADGFVRSEGCGIIVLKRLSDAVAAGDPVLAVLLGSAVNQDGRSSGFTVPNGLAQQAVIRSALQRAGVAPAEVSYVEAHGTGTSLGDPIEVEAIGTVLARGRTPEQPLVLGSAKTNIGHCESASGIAGLIKTILALHHNTIPPHLHVEERSPRIPWPDFEVQIPAAPMPWPEGYTRRIAGVSSFGFSGTNAHVILEEAPGREDAVQEDAVVAPEASAHILALSAKTKPALQELASRFADFLEAHPGDALADICHTATTGRAQFKHRLAVVAADTAEAQRKLAEIKQDRTVPGVSRGEAPLQAPEVAFLFTGQGAQYPQMGRRLYAEQPVFRKALDRCDEILQPLLGGSLLDVLFGTEEQTGRIHQTAYTQPALFAIEYALYELWRSFGVHPTVVLGHSVGELVAACVAGVFSLEDGLTLIAARARLMQALPQDGAMAAVMTDAARVEQLIEPHAGAVSMAAYNGPRHVVISGTREAVEAVVQAVEQSGGTARRLKVSHAFHSALMEPMLEAFEQVAETIRYSPPRLALVSNVTGRVAGEEVAQAGYWKRHVRAAVRFEQGMQALWELGCRLFVEVGPHPVLVGMGQPCVDSDDARWIGTMRRNRPDLEQLLEGVGALYTAGVDVDWKGVQGERRRRVLLPTYPFQRTRYWVEEHDRSRSSSRSRTDAGAGHPLLGEPFRSPAFKGVLFQSHLGASVPAYLTDHRIHGAAILPATAYLDLSLSAAKFVFDGDHSCVETLLIERPLVLPDEGTLPIQVLVSEEETGSRSIEVFSQNGSGKWIRHAEARIARAPATEQPVPVPLDSLRAGLDVHFDLPAYYQKLSRVGAQYGPAFRGVQDLRGGPGEALGRIVLPEEAGSGRGYEIHPALLDACFHVAGAALPPALAEAEQVFVPVRVERFTVHKPGFSEAWCRVVLDPRGPDAPAHMFSCSVQLFNAAGQPLADLTGLKVKRVNPTSFARRQEVDATTWLYEVAWQPREPEATPEASTPPGPRRWLIFVDQGGLGAALAAQLEQQGDSCIMVSLGDSSKPPDDGSYHVNPTRREDVVQLLALEHQHRNAPLHGAVYLWNLDTAQEPTLESIQNDQAAPTQGLLHLTQALATEAAPPRLWMVTRGAQAVEGEPLVSLNQTPSWGLVRTLTQEHPELQCVGIDLDPSLPSTGQAAAFAAALRTTDDENQVALRDGRRYVARLVRRAASVQDEWSWSQEQPFKVEVTQRGTLDHITLTDGSRRAPGPGEVEIRVLATGLNFRDVLNVMGMYPGQLGPPGQECAGRVVRVGEGVEEFQAGDAVIALAAESFSTFVTTHADVVVPKPAHVSFEEAATILSTFLTAYYGLHELADMKAGQRVLIHAAAGGVGLAAVQLAQQTGAEIFGTAGNPEKRAFLRSLGVHHVMDSRTLDFAEEIDKITNGEGVDIVLNAFTGDFIPKSFSVLKEHGHFLEIGKREIWTREQVNEVNATAKYLPYDLGEVLADDPARGKAMLRKLIDQFQEGRLKPLPMTVFPMQRVTDAFRYMARAKHIGKIVVTQPDDQDQASDAVGLVRADATYLITGGFGGLGLEVAHRLAQQGARHLVLVGRGGAREETQPMLTQLERQGVTVHAVRADVSKADEVERVLTELEASLPPLRGVVHAAGVLEDGLLAQQSWASFERVMAPKVQGAWNLHALTRDLDFFVLFSSGSAVLGSPGQANYAAANAFLDGLAHYRRAQGLPGLSINWGPWADVGMAARIDDRDRQRWETAGMGLIAPQQGVDVLERMMQRSRYTAEVVQVAVLPIDWARWKQHNAALATAPLFKQVIGDAAAAAAGDEPPVLTRNMLASVSADERLKHLQSYIGYQVSRVLKIPSSSLDADEPLTNLGLDSLMALELKNRVEADLQVTVRMVQLLEGPSVALLAAWLADELEQHEDAVEGPAAQALREPGKTNGAGLEHRPAEALLANLDTLSDDQVDLLLASMGLEESDTISHE